MQSQAQPVTAPPQSTATLDRPEKQRRDSPRLNFARHYAEMLVAMFLGMGVLGLTGWSAGSSELELLVMAFAMSVPMVAWMRYRGHAWRFGAEMTASMFVPGIAAIALLWAGLVEDREALLAIQHVAMFPSMLVAMLLRRSEYTGHGPAAAHSAHVPGAHA